MLHLPYHSYTRLQTRVIDTSFWEFNQFLTNNIQSIKIFT